MTERVGAPLDRNALVHLGSLAEFLVHRRSKAALDLFERHPVLRALRPSERRFDRGKLKLEHLGEDRIRRRLGVVHALRLAVGQHQRNAIRGAAGIAQIADSVFVDWKEAASGAVFRRHVAECGAVGNGQIGHAGTEIFDELADHAALAQHLRDGQDEIGRGNALLELAVEPHADHFRQQHRIRLTEHRGFSFDAADTPAEHRQPVDHGGVRIGADQRVRISKLVGDRLVGEFQLGLRSPHRLRKIFEIDLMADASAGWHHAEILKRALRPFQEPVALLILFVLFVDVLFERGVAPEIIDHNRMIDDEVDRHQRIDLVRIAAEHLHGVAHGGEIDHRRHAGEILHQHPRRPESDFTLGRFSLEPLRNRLDVVLGHRAAVLIAQQILEQHLERERQPGNPLQAVLFRRRKAVIGVGLGANLERPQAFKAIEGGHGLFSHHAGRRPAQ